MKFERIYIEEKCYNRKVLVGYKFDRGTIMKDVRNFGYNQIVDGWEVLDEQGNRLFYCDTLTEAKAFAEYWKETGNTNICEFVKWYQERKAK